MSLRTKQIGFAIFTFLIYAWLIPPSPNWQAALLLVVGVGFHEYSHLWAAKRIGMQTKGFFLIPFIGGVALISGRYKTYSQQVFVVMLGPVGGGLLALITAGLWYLTGYPFLAAAAFWMCFLNLLNLLPLSFIDGGQLMNTITYSLNKTVGMALHTISTIAAPIIIWQFNPFIAMLIAVLGGGAVIKEIRNWNNFRKNKEWLCDDSYLNPPDPLTKKQIVMTASSWAITVVVLSTAMYYLNKIPESSISTIIHN